jgi:hypothetical protein
LSLFLLYLRIFSCNRATKIAIWAGIGISGLFYSATAIFFGVACVPRPHNTWLITALSPQCSSTKRMNYAHGSFGVVSDLYIFILPLPGLWKLQLPVKKKVGVCAIFLAGLM